jgi:hypothetical protein
MRLERVEPGRVLALRSQDGNWVWSFVLAEESGRTRLISRNRFRLPTLIARLGMIPMEPASLMMERRMLLGIRARAERLAEARLTDAASPGPVPTLRVRARAATHPPGAENGSRRDAPRI